MATNHSVHVLTERELRERLMTCAHDCLVECETCASDYRVDELAIDAFAAPPRYFLCPLCANDLAGAVRDHAETCREFVAGS